VILIFKFFRNAYFNFSEASPNILTSLNNDQQLTYKAVQLTAMQLALPEDYERFIKEGEQVAMEALEAQRKLLDNPNGTDACS